MIKKLIRVGEKNNFNFTQKEKDSLETFKKKDTAFFVNSNSKVVIDPSLQSIVTINPDLDTFTEPKGDLSNVKAFRVKVYEGMGNCLNDCVEYANKANIPILVTYMRFRSKKTFKQFIGVEAKDQNDYVFDGGYYRPIKDTQKSLLKAVKSLASTKVVVCDPKGTGCPDCGQCASLNGHSKDTPIHSLNLSVSGIKDKNGNLGLCPFSCPDCWAKIVTFGKRPLCDKVIQNRKQKGEIEHI